MSLFHGDDTLFNYIKPFYVSDIRGYPSARNKTDISREPYIQESCLAVVVEDLVGIRWRN